MRSPFITTAPRFQRSWRADLPPRGEGARVEGTLAPPGGLRVDAPVVVHRERVDAGEGGELARVSVGFARSIHPVADGAAHGRPAQPHGAARVAAGGHGLARDGLLARPRRREAVALDLPGADAVVAPEGVR